MAAKQLVFSEDARRKLKNGMNCRCERGFRNPRSQGPQCGN